MSVDFPAPFSPTIPWISPFVIERSMSRFARTGPKFLEIPLSSMAGATRSGRPETEWLDTALLVQARLHDRATLVGKVVMNAYFARNDFLGGSVGCHAHFVRNQVRVVLVESVADSVVRQPENRESCLEVT